ncbi:heme peroxidase [Mycena vitilis]|nr:heme peroxidase [Mycena vitilis]
MNAALYEYEVPENLAHPAAPTPSAAALEAGQHQGQCPHQGQRVYRLPGQQGQWEVREGPLQPLALVAGYALILNAINAVQASVARIESGQEQLKRQLAIIANGQSAAGPYQEVPFVDGSLPSVAIDWGCKRHWVQTHALQFMPLPRPPGSDVAAHNISDGTGGLDGSIFFETARSENVGAGMNNTLSDFSTYPNKYVSRADIIAIGTVFAVSTCGGPVIPFRGGRVDANVASPSSVPDPRDSLDSLTNNFAKQGFNVSEMIQLVACGHTLGGMRYPDFPTIVTGSGGGTVVDLFDGTQQYDHNIVTTYLDGTTQNPLIVLNQTMASDMRVFSSDSNITMQRWNLSFCESMNSADSFASTCTTVLDKMLNTVPSGVTLTDEIALLPVKVSAVQLTVAGSKLQFSASVRHLGQDVLVRPLRRRRGLQVQPPALRRLQWLRDRVSPISTAMNVNLKKYQFVVPIDPAQSIAKFWFVVDYGNGTTTTADNGGSDYVMEQDSVLFVPSMSRGKNVLTGSLGVNVVAAVKTNASASRVYMDCFGRATTNYIAANGTYDLARNTSIPSVAGYDFYSGTATDDFGATMSFDLYATAGDGTDNVDAYRQSGLIGVSLPAAAVVNSTTSGSVGGSSEAALLDARWWWVGVAGLASVWTLRYL